MSANIITITAAELQHGDDVDGDLIDFIDVQGAKTWITYQGDDTRMRVASAQPYTVLRENGVSTVVAATPEPVVEDPAARSARMLADSLAAAAATERRIRNEYARDDYARRNRIR